MSSIPFHIRIMAKLGIVKVTKKEPEQRIYKDAEDYFNLNKKRRSYSSFLPVGIMLPILLTSIPLLLSLSSDDETEQTDLQDELERIANSEGKLDWQKEEWDNPNATIRLNELKVEIDNASCEKLIDLFQNNERWTLRPYVAHTILERSCQ